MAIQKNNMALTYKWRYASDWLDHYLDSIDNVAILRNMVSRAYAKHGDDDIIDEFDSEMKGDGYYEFEETCLVCEVAFESDDDVWSIEVDGKTEGPYCEECVTERKEYLESEDNDE